MSNVTKVTGATLAAATAMLFAAASVQAADTGKTGAQQAEVQCFGINACKGQASCKTAQNDCKGQNSCKGHGFVMASASDCTAKGGKVQTM